MKTQRGVVGAIDLAIAAVAGPQHGVIAVWQLLDLGLGRGAIEHRVRSGRLYRLHRGVYAVGHRPLSPLAHAMAAVLACGPGAALSHRSAAALWGVNKHHPSTPEVTTRAGRLRPGIRIHRSCTLTDADVTEHFGIPVTSPARTVFDNAPRLNDVRLARAVNALRRARYLSLADLAELLDRQPPCAATKQLREHVAHPERAPTRSEFEDAFILFAKRYGLPDPLVNSDVLGYEIDIFFPAHKLVVELDGYEDHGPRAQFEDDRDRDADLLAAGIATVRITWERLTMKPAREAARLHVILESRASLAR
jgi:predicted transcriptional regulator of viral defense system